MENTKPLTRFPCRPEVLVRFADADLLGHVNNAKYFTYMEESRLYYFKQIPELDFVGKKSFELSVILASITCDFLTPARIHNVIVAALGVAKMGRKSITMEYRLYEKNSGQKLAKGSSTLVMFNFEKNQSIEIPENIRQRIQEIENHPLPDIPWDN